MFWVSGTQRQPFSHLPVSTVARGLEWLQEHVRFVAATWNGPSSLGELPPSGAASEVEDSYLPPRN